MPALITDLIDKLDNMEVIRDQIAAVLTVEQANQQALATAAGKEPREWALRVFVEHSNPWGELMQDAPTDPLEVPPIVNVVFENSTVDLATSNKIERQKAVGTFNLDVYGYGVTEEVPGGGHEPGDRGAALAAHRGVRLIRNILMADVYTYLGLPHGPNSGQFVWGRHIASITEFTPEFDGRYVQNVVAVRCALQVEYNEFSPQVTPCPISGVLVEVVRDDNGELFLAAEYPATAKGNIGGSSTLSGTVIGKQI